VIKNHESNCERYFKELKTRISRRGKANHKQIDQCPDSGAGLEKRNSNAQHHFHEIKKFTRRQLIMGQQLSQGETFSDEQSGERIAARERKQIPRKMHKIFFYYLLEAQAREESNAARSKR